MDAFRAQAWIESFSSRELEVLRLISNGLSNREIAQKLFLSIETIKWYNKQMFMKLGVRNRTQAVNKASDLNLLDPGQAFAVQGKTPSGGYLPAQLTSYVGREKEIGEIKSLMQDHRLVVLTGAGGSGKTRLAMQVAERMVEGYKDGVWLVELANIHDPSMVLQTIAKVLNLAERPDATLDEVLKRYLGRRRLLLLIDNLEHLLECATLIGDLLAAAPGLSVLGTSRERLHIYGEQEYPVHPLALPEKSNNRTSKDLENVESIALFIKRARAVQPTFAPDEQTLKDLARICVRLDGLPLAIELCAPLVKIFPPGMIIDQIEKGLDAIPFGPRDLPARQRTLRGAIQWGVDLLDGHEKRLFVRMAVFNGGATLQAVEVICGDGIPGNIGNTLSALVNKNLVLAQEREDGEIHFGMLETIRQYAHEKMLASDETEELAARHAGYFMALAKQGAVGLRGPDQINWSNRLIQMYTNMRAGLEWTIAKGNVESALEFASNLHEFWLRNSDFEEGQRWMERVLALPNAEQFKEAYSMVFNGLTWFYYMLGTPTEALDMAEQALLLARSQSNQLNQSRALLTLGLLLAFQGEYERARTYQEEAQKIIQAAHDEWELARTLMHLGVTQTRKKEYATARSLFSESFNVYKKLGDLLFQGVVKMLIGNLEVDQNNLLAGVEAHREALRIARVVKNNLQIANNIYDLAQAEMLTGNHLGAVQLLLASKTIYEDIGAWSGRDDLKLDEALGTARTGLSETEFQSALKSGQRMTMEEAIELALKNEVETGITNTP